MVEFLLSLTVKLGFTFVLYMSVLCVRARAWVFVCVCVYGDNPNWLSYYSEILSGIKVKCMDFINKYTFQIFDPI